MTAEYSLLPASTGERTQREASRGKQGGRTIEIQRLIGRALRSVCDFKALGERTLWLDCDVLQADGGTRCAAISGAYVAARRALDRFGLSKALTGSVAAVSVGIVEGRALLDLDYAEDSAAETDMNVVMTADGRLVEVQATAERDPFSRELLDELLDLAAGGVEEIMAAQDGGDRSRACLTSRPPRRCSGCCSPPTLGGAIGLERELRDHEAGLRTHLLVSLGACVFTLVSAYAWTDWTFSQSSGVTLDPTRIAAQIVTGIGFLGAGAIIVRGINVRGLTTAATLWVVAAIGMAAGTGYYGVARRRRAPRARLARAAEAPERAVRLPRPAGGGDARRSTSRREARGRACWRGSRSSAA